MKGENLKNEMKIFNFPKGKYYFIKNLSNKQYLTACKSEQHEIQNLSFDNLDNFNLLQVWMIEEIAEETFQILNPYSSFVLEQVDNNVILALNKLKNSQTFFLQKSKSEIDCGQQNVFVVKEFKSSKKYLHVDDQRLKCQDKPIFRDECNKWQISPVINHSLISQTCLIENYYSGLFLEVYQSKQTQGQKIVQNMLSNQFHQRWQIIQKDQFFVFKSLKTGFVIDIKGQKNKEGSILIQWKFKNTSNQKWILEKHGKRIFIIRSVMDKSLMLGIKANSLKDEGDLVLTRNEEQSFWRIIGNFDI